MTIVLKAANCTLGRALISILIYTVLTIVVIEIYYALAILLSPSDREFRLLPLDQVFLAHQLAYEGGYATAPHAFISFSHLFWVVFWCAVLYARILQVQLSKKYFFMRKIMILGISTLLGLVNVVILGNNGPEFFNLYFSTLIFFNFCYFLLINFVPLNYLKSISSGDKSQQ